VASPLEHIELFQRIAHGDEAAFRDIFHIFTPRLHVFLYRIVKSNSITEGLIQDVFMKLWLNKEEVAQKDDPASWLFTVAANHAFNHLKKMSTKQRYIEYIKREMAVDTPPEAEESLALKESREAFYEALDKLPQQRRLIFTMSRVQGLSHKEIAVKLQISPFTVKNQVIAALDFMRKHLHRKDAYLVIGINMLYKTFSDLF
jgi:RNA polymerase sigma-70 factor (ECF subfamily)